MKRHTLIVAIASTLFLAHAPAPAQVDRARRFETRHYRVWTDVDQDLATDLCARLDAMYEEYARRFAALAADLPSDEKYDVRIFARADDYARFTQDRLPNSAGMFMPERKLLVALLEGHGREGLRQTLQHEAFHQFADRAVGPHMPMWLNEGIAQIFEEAIWTGHGFLVGQVTPRRLRQLRRDVTDGKLRDFRAMLTMRPRDWADSFNEPGATAALYNQAWAMSHFLIYASGPDGQPLHRARVLDLLRRAKDGQGPYDAFTGAFSRNVDGFRERFLEFARVLTPTPDAARIDNQAVLGDMLVQLSTRGQKFDSIDAFRDYLRRAKMRLRYTNDGAFEWETAADPTVYFNDPDGRAPGPRELFFEPRAGAPLPDIVCRTPQHFQIRTRFHARAGGIERELVVEPRR